MMDCTLLGVLVLVVIAASLCELWCLRRRIAELEDEADDEMWWALEYCRESVRNRRRAERYHEHALRERGWTLDADGITFRFGEVSTWL